VVRLTLPLLLAIALAAPVAAAQTAPPPAAPALTRDDVAAWLDGFLPYALTRGDVAGAVVAIVKGKQILLVKGYGFADVAARTPVDPDRTLFRTGSVGKLVTWTAVMQMVEQGKLHLDRDIQPLLSFPLPRGTGQPITLRHLMTHTPGFEESVRALVTSDSSQRLALEDYLRARSAARIFPPGTIPAYSNRGVAMAGHLVEKASGQRFDDYLDQHVFAPLGMTSSTFRQPLPASLAPRMAKGYPVGSGAPQPFEMFGPAPAGSLTSTGTDMARFMIAHIGHGASDTTRILRPETARLMYNSALEVIPPLHHMALGFFRRDVNGRRVIAHEGDTQFFHSALAIFIDDSVGVFLSMNSTGKQGAVGPIRTELMERFADRYFPAPPVTATVDKPTALQHARLMEGRYDASRRAESSFLSLFFMLAQVTVGVSSDSSIMVPALAGTNGEPKQWREISPFVWQEVGGKERLAAKVENGRVTMFSVDAVSPFTVFLPVPARKSGAWLVPLLVTSVVVYLLTLVAWPVGAIARRRYRVPPGNVRAVGARGWVRVAAFATLALMAAWVATMLPVGSNLFFYAPSLDLWIWFLHIASLIVFVGSAIVAFWNARLVWKNHGPWSAKLWSVLLVIGALALLWIGFDFNLIAFNTSY
jgi:CubicO group peptidase (beta-lactamase class C family)